MTIVNQTSKSFFSTETLSPQDLEEILGRIDENLELRPLLAAGEPIAADSDEEVALAPLPDLGDLSGRIHSVRSFNAPYFLIHESGLRGWLKRLVNLPLRVFGYKQALFNSHVLDMLDLLAIQVQALRHRSEAQAREERQQRRRLREATQQLARIVEELDEPGNGIGEKTETNRQRIDLLRADIESAVARVHAIQEEIAAVGRLEAQATTARRDIDGQSAWLQQIVESQQELARQLHGQSTWIQQVVDTQQQLADQQVGQSKWIELVQRETHAAALSARSTKGATEAVSRQEPRVVNDERYRALVASMPDGLRVNLGSGIRPKEGWINVDARALPEVDVAADVRALPFEPGSVAEFEAAHLVEHFRQHEMAHTILPYWRSLLKPGGTLRVICPNLEAIVKRGAAGALTLDQVKELTFGGQDYEGNDHFAMYWPESLRQTLLTAGFAPVEVIATERDNGICPELEVVAHA